MLKTIFVSLVFVLYIGAVTTNASAQAVADASVFASPSDRGLCAGDVIGSLFCGNDLAGVMNTIFQLSISLGAVLALLRICYSGYLYMGSADMWSDKTKAKQVFQDAIVGLLILLSIWLILYQINPCILDLSVLNTGKNSCDTSTSAPATPQLSPLSPGQQNA